LISTAIGVDGRALSDVDAGYGGKRPLSSMSPTLVFHRNTSSTFGSPYIALGAPGGSRIIGSVFHTLVNLLDFQVRAEDAKVFIMQMLTSGLAVGL